MLDQVYNEMKSQMQKTIIHYKDELVKIRTGRASTSLIENINNLNEALDAKSKELIKQNRNIAKYSKRT